MGIVNSAAEMKRSTSYGLERVQRGSLFEVLLASIVAEFMAISDARRFKTLRDEDFRLFAGSLSQIVLGARKHGYSSLMVAADTLLSSIEDTQKGNNQAQCRFLLKQALEVFVVECQHTLTEMEERGQNSTITTGSRAVVMVIDDDAWEYNQIRRAVGKDHNVIYANCSNAAIKLLFETRPDLIVLDVSMPGMKGTDLLRELKDIPELASIPILMRSNISEDDEVVRSLVNGALDYLSKDLNETQLRERILDSLHQGRPRLRGNAGN